MKDQKLLWVGLVFVALAVIGFIFVDFTPSGWAHEHTYEDAEEVYLWVNKVGPFPNPQETYPYYSLPFCHPQELIHSDTEGLGEALVGYDLIKSMVEIEFKKNVERKVVCPKTLTKSEYEEFREAILEQYWYQMYLDDLPVWGMVGESYEEDGGDKKVFIYTHQKFSLSWNGNRVIEVNLTSENPAVLEPGTQLEFTYSVTWHETSTSFEDRFRKYLDKSFFEHQIHWFSIFNSFMMVIFLVGLVSLILMRTLKRDYARFGKIDDEDSDRDEDVGDESGWKQIKGDVFRSPPRLLLFSALVGTGHQLVILVFCLLCLAALGTYYAQRGTVVTAFILCYALTSFIAGYGGGGYYARNGGKKWIKCMVVSAGLLPGIAFIIAFLLNTIALSYGSLNYIPLGTLIAVLAIWAFISLPLTLVGTVVGKNWNGTPEKVRINQVPRQIPEKRWYLQPWVHIVLGGVLPFGSIFIEMYFIFTSFYKYYYVYGFMLLVYVILIIVTVCVTIVSTYFLLNSEDYRWQWTSFLSAASTAAYVFLYSVYYFYVKTKMSGFFQTVFYFGYMAMFCLGLATLCGAIGFIGTSMFVKRIYTMIKGD
jgi:transmembrane 9 superfamily protein 3